MLFQNEAVPPWEFRKNKKNLRNVKAESKPKVQTLLSGAGGAVQVWVNLKSGKYHCPDTRYYGNTKRGEMMLESKALKSGYRGAHGAECQ